MRVMEHMSENLNISAQKATEEIFEIFGMRPAGAQGEKVAQSIEHVIVRALTVSVEQSTEAAKKACSSNSKMSKQIVLKINDAHTALIANLSSMR